MPWGDCTGPWWAQEGNTSQPPAGNGWGRGRRGWGRGRGAGIGWFARLFGGQGRGWFGRGANYNNPPANGWFGRGQGPNPNIRDSK